MAAQRDNPCRPAASSCTSRRWPPASRCWAGWREARCGPGVQELRPARLGALWRTLRPAHPRGQVPPGRIARGCGRAQAGRLQPGVGRCRRDPAGDGAGAGGVRSQERLHQAVPQAHRLPGPAGEQGRAGPDHDHGRRLQPGAGPRARRGARRHPARRHHMRMLAETSTRRKSGSNGSGSPRAPIHSRARRWRCAAATSRCGMWAATSARHCRCSSSVQSAGGQE